MIFIVFLVQYLKIAKGNIADCHIKEAVRHLHLFKTGNGNAAVLVKLLGDSSADRVDLHTVGFAAVHAVRHHANEVADTAGRLQNVALTKAHL